MHERKVFLLVFVCLLALSVVWPVWAQGGPALSVELLDVGAGYPEMSAIVSVVNPSGVPIRDLTEDDFEVLEDGQPLALTGVAGEPNPDQVTAVVLVLDLSGSAPLDDVKAAANQFLDHLGSSDRVALIGFNTPLNFDTFDPFKESDFTTDKDLIRGIIDGLTMVGQSAVYEAIYKGVLITAQESAGRRAVIVMTDGYDTHSRPEIATADTPKTAARERHIPVFTVGVYNPDPKFGRNPDYLKVLASESGGRYQEATDPTELGNLFQNVVDQLRLQYRLTFRTDRKPDGKDHVLAFRVTTTEGQATRERTVSYPAAPSVPTILIIQRDVNGELQTLVSGSELKGKVLLVPEISAQNPIVKVEYQVDGQLAYTAIVEMQRGKATHQPWEWWWDTGQVAEGEHQLTVIAYDDAGMASSPNLVSVQVARSKVVIFGRSVEPTIVIAVVVGVAFLALLFIFLLLYSRRPAPVSVSPTVPMQGPPTTTPAMPTMPPPPGVPPGPGYVPTAPPTPGYPPASPAVSGYRPTVPPTAPAAPGMPPGAGPGVAPPVATEAIYKELPAMGWLIMQQGPQAGREFRLAEVTAIGRTGDNDVVLDDPSVSRRHAKVKLQGKTFWIHDLGATNTTKVNGQEVGRHQLTDGDRVEIGRMTLVFKQVRPEQA